MMKDTGRKLQNIWHQKANLIKDNLASFLFTPIQEKKFDQASKIAYACEIDGACPCDSDICIIE